MGNIIRLHGDEHHEIQALLPWYVNGRLEGEEHARVAAHLAACAECQADARFQRRLAAEDAGPTADVEQGWRNMRRMIEQAPARRPAFDIGDRLAGAWCRGGPWLGWAVAAAAVIVVASPLLKPRPAATYHALGAPPAAAAANVVVVFRPDASEADLRRTLNLSHARVVDGPTPADAYMLRVPAAARDGAVAFLRAQSTVVLAQPIDAAGARP